MENVLDTKPVVSTSKNFPTASKPSKLTDHDQGNDYKVLAKEIKNMIENLGYKSSAWVVDSRKMFK